MPHLDPDKITKRFTNLDAEYGRVRADYLEHRRAANFEPGIPQWARPPRWRPNEDAETYTKRSNIRWFSAWTLLRAIMIAHKVRPFELEFIRDARYDELHAGILAFIAFLQKKGEPIPAILGPDVTFITAREIGKAPPYNFPPLGACARARVRGESPPHFSSWRTPRMQERILPASWARRRGSTMFAGTKCSNRPRGCLVACPGTPACCDGRRGRQWENPPRGP